MKKTWSKLVVLLLLFGMFGTGCSEEEAANEPVQEEQEIKEETSREDTWEEPEENPVEQEDAVEEEQTLPTAPEEFSLSDVPSYSGSAYVVVHNNIPYFTSEEITATSFESYSELDSLGRCSVACSSVGQDLMPVEERGSIGQVKPSGWHTVKYDCVNGKYLYNRCHLIGYQLTAENANTKNLITGTRYLNMEGMLPFENMAADYIKETGNHVMYRVSPIFEGDNLLASGVLMEGYSVEDSGAGICYCIYAYNVQPGIEIDYATGDSYQKDGASSAEAVTPPAQTASSEEAYILNTNTKKFHKPSCSSINQMSPENTAEYTGSREDLINQGYSPCKRCNP